DTIHAFKPLPVPLSGVGADEHDMIERSNGGANPNSMENRAALKIMNQRVFQEVAGLWVDVTATATLEGWYNPVANSFTDYREAEDVDVVEIDMALFAASTLYPKNGIVYVSDQHPARDYPALHLKNGADIGGNLTFVSENPVYIEGDYNTIGKNNASVISDAVTFLSTDWSSHKAQPLVADRSVSLPMTVNCSFATGHVESDGGNYSGGAENLIRYLEDWNGKTVTWRGSLVCLWESEQAKDPFNYSYFVRPQTDYAFDPDLEDPLNSPPGSPIVRSYRRFGWQHETVGYANVQVAP
ncbi:MAG TPA: hypothetical protein VLB27_09710, partial [candidate division Zixibacteria bacterium]|nr:hypothetical protein [candidate division Zixibacteria bacterium]